MIIKMSYLNKLESNIGITLLHFDDDLSQSNLNNTEIINPIINTFIQEYSEKLYTTLSVILNELGYNKFYNVPVLSYKDDNNMEKFIVSGHLIVTSTVYQNPIYIDEFFKNNIESKQKFLNIIFKLDCLVKNSVAFRENLTRFVIWNNINTIECLYIVLLIAVQYKNYKELLQKLDKYNATINDSIIFKQLENYFENTKLDTDVYSKLRNYVTTDYNWISPFDNMVIDTIF